MNYPDETSGTRIEWQSWVFLQVRKLLSWLGTDLLVQGSLLAIIHSSVIFGMAQMVPQLEPSMLSRPVIAGLVMGWLFGMSRLTARRAWALMLGCGVILVVAIVGGLGMPFWKITWELNGRALADQVLPVSSMPIQLEPLETTLPNSRGDLAPLLLADLELWGNFRILLVRGETWLSGLLRREAGFDPLITTLVWSMILWFLGAWSSWAVKRKGSPLQAVLPAGVMLSVSLAYTGNPTPPLLVFLGASLMLVAWNSFSRRLQGWERQGVDYAEDLRLDVTITALLLTLAFVALAWVAPFFSIERFERFIDSFRPKVGETTREIGEPLGLSPRTEELPPDERKARTALGTKGLPREHLLGSGPELSMELVMTISTGDLPRLPFELAGSIEARRYYWRALTYDQYTGSGWSSSSTQPKMYPPGEAIHPGFILFPEDGGDQIIHPNYQRPGLRVMQQVVTENADLNGLVYVSGDLLGLNQGYRSLWRLAPELSAGFTGDLFAAVKIGENKTYKAWSALPQPGESALRSVENAYPQWVVENYLGLPEDLPQRVRDLAQSLTTQAPGVPAATTYDRALAIETYLRTFPYTLELPAPPANRDVVDYFIFDLKEGYCDYYASAMVVLARAAGIPARLAVGYASGSYNPEQAVYLVSEANGHSWPEIYFPGYGWVAFEPTAGLPVIVRPNQVDLAASAPVMPEQVEPELPEAWMDRFKDPLAWLRMTVYLVFGAVTILFAWHLSEPARINRQEPAQAILSIYRRLYRLGERAGNPAGRGDTPNEFAHRLADHLEKTGAQKRWKQWINRAMSPADTRLAILQLASLYSRTQYSPHLPTAEERWQAARSWGWLRWRIWLIAR